MSCIKIIFNDLRNIWWYIFIWYWISIKKTSVPADNNVSAIYFNEIYSHFKFNIKGSNTQETIHHNSMHLISFQWHIFRYIVMEIESQIYWIKQRHTWAFVKTLLILRYCWMFKSNLVYWYFIFPACATRVTFLLPCV